MESRYDEVKAQRAIDFFEKLLVHTKSPWDRQPFLLAPFQRDIIDPLFGELVQDPDDGAWVRRYTLAWLEMARKNGKSELMAGMALLLTGADDEEGAEVYSVARDTDQASAVFDVAKRMLELSGLGGPPRSGKRFVIYPTNRRIVYPKTGSFYRVIPADSLGNLGANPHGILFDEVIAQPNGDLWSVLKSGFGTRRQPLMVAATTAGKDPASFAHDEHTFSMRVQADPNLDPRRFVFIAAIPEDKDWRDEANWPLANPALGLFLRPQVLRDELQTALNNPREEREFRWSRANQWQSGGEAEAIPYAEWIACVGMVPEEKVLGKPAWGGLVAASATDLSSICWVFQNPEKAHPAWWMLWRHFIPEAYLSVLDDRTSGKASVWKKSGKLTLTEGNVIDVAAHTRQLIEDIERFDVRELAYDPNGTIGIVQPIIEQKIATVVPTYASTPGSAVLDLDRLSRAREIAHGSNPLLIWQVANLMGKTSPAGILKIDRNLSKDNVSGVAAMEMAMRRALVGGGKKATWQMDPEGVIIV